ncbi:hypothetical protein SEA_MANDALORIAN_58 [Microbacterium phage Mandalorian]|nr:hypothetical protein SEA_MANDALORIAN_58 [Microbacterium phage Mandalorian]
MPQAYQVVFVEVGLYNHDPRGAVQMAQQSADQKFEALAQEARLTRVTRDPEPRVMTYPEVANAFPEIDPNTVVGLYFTADIT